MRHIIIPFFWSSLGVLVLACSGHHVIGPIVPDEAADAGTLPDDDADVADGPMFAEDSSASDTGSTAQGCHLATLGTTGPYASNVFTKWLDQTSDAGVASLLNQVLTPSLLSPYRMIVVLDITQNHNYAPKEVAALESWVKSGGGLMTVTGYHGPPEPLNVNLLLAPYGMQYASNLVLNCGPAPATCPINQWTPHPITAGITSIGFGNGFAVLGSGTMIAHSQGYDVLEAKVVGGGHVVLWGDEWITLDENWTAHPEYQMQKFWQNIVDWLDPSSGCKVPMPN